MSENQNPDTPQQPSEDVISDYYDGVKKLEMEGYETGIRKARTTLFVIAGLILAAELITASILEMPLTPLLIGIIAVETGIFVALGFWTKTKPYSAIMVGLIIYILMSVLSLVIVGKIPGILGIVIKIVIISYLANALKPAKAWENLRKNG